MVYTGIFATLLEVQYKAGANASTTATAEAYVNSFMAQAESYINAATQYNYSDAYAGLNADLKAILSECASCIAASYCINYDMSNFNSRQEATTMLDFLKNRADICIGILSDKSNQFVAGI
jgi:hypothetical protein